MAPRIKPKSDSKQIAKRQAHKAAKADQQDERQARRTAEFQHKRFLTHYFRYGNGTQAALSIGVSEKSASVYASQLLSKPNIRAQVQAYQARLQERTDISVEKVANEIAKLAFSNMQDYITVNESGEANIDLSELDEYQLAAIQEITTEVYMEGNGDDAVPVKRTKIKLYDKGANLEKLGRYLGMFGTSRGGQHKAGEGDQANDEPPAIQYTLNIGHATVNVGATGTDQAARSSAQPIQIEHKEG